MGSRHLQGTIFARVKALLASGTLKKKPVWYDVMEAFPPLVQSQLTDFPSDGRPPVVTYKEDEIRDLFYTRFPLLRKIPINCFENDTEISGEVSAFKTRSKFETKSAHLPTIDVLINKYRELIKTSNDHETAFNQSVDWLVKEEQIAKMKSSWAKEVETKRQKNEEMDGQKGHSKDDIDIMDLFNLKLDKNK